MTIGRENSRRLNVFDFERVEILSEKSMMMMMMMIRIRRGEGRVGEVKSKNLNVDSIRLARDVFFFWLLLSGINKFT